MHRRSSGSAIIHVRLWQWNISSHGHQRELEPDDIVLPDDKRVSACHLCFKLYGYAMDIVLAPRPDDHGLTLVRLHRSGKFEASAIEMLA